MNDNRNDVNTKIRIQATEGNGEMQDNLCGSQNILCGPLWANLFLILCMIKFNSTTRYYLFFTQWITGNKLMPSR